MWFIMTLSWLNKKSILFVIDDTIKKEILSHQLSISIPIFYELSIIPIAALSPYYNRWEKSILYILKYRRY